MKDIGELSYPELEGLIDGLNKNAQRESDEIEGKRTKKGDAHDLLNFIGGNSKDI